MGILIDGSYQMLGDEAGVVQSRLLPGLWIGLHRILEPRRFRPSLLRTLERGSASPEHSEFVEKLSPATDPNLYDPGAYVTTIRPL